MEFLSRHLDLLWAGSIAAAPVAVIVAALCRWMVARPATRHSLWVIVLLTFLAPALTSFIGPRSTIEFESARGWMNAAVEAVQVRGGAWLDGLRNEGRAIAEMIHRWRAPALAQRDVEGEHAGAAVGPRVADSQSRNDNWSLDSRSSALPNETAPVASSTTPGEQRQQQHQQATTSAAGAVYSTVDLNPGDASINASAGSRPGDLVAPDRGADDSSINRDFIFGEDARALTSEAESSAPLEVGPGISGTELEVAPPSDRKSTPAIDAPVPRPELPAEATESSAPRTEAPSMTPAAAATRGELALDESSTSGERTHGAVTLRSETSSPTTRAITSLASPDGSAAHSVPETELERESPSDAANTTPPKATTTGASPARISEFENPTWGLAGEWRAWLAAVVQARDAIAAIPAPPVFAWALAFGLAFTTILWRLLSTLRWRRRSVPVGAETQRAVDGAAGALGLSQSPRAYFVEGRISPMICCVNRPRLLLPRTLWDELGEDSRQAILVHELAHLRRRDHWVLWVELFTTLLYWWHPVVWWSRKRIREEADLCCDAWVTTLLPGSRRAYAQALVATRTYLKAPGRPRSVAGLNMASAPARRFARRLTMVMTERVGPRISPLGGALAAGVAVIGFVVAPGLTCPPDKDKVVKVSIANSLSAEALEEIRAAVAQAPALADEAAREAITALAQVELSNVLTSEALAELESAVAAAPGLTSVGGLRSLEAALAVEAVECPDEKQKAPKPPAPGSPQPAPSTFERHQLGGATNVRGFSGQALPPNASMEQKLRALEERVRRLEEKLQQRAPGAAAGFGSGAHAPSPGGRTSVYSFSGQGAAGGGTDFYAPATEGQPGHEGGGGGVHFFEGAEGHGGRFFHVAPGVVDGDGGSFFYSWTGEDDGEVIVRTYKLPDGKLEEFSQLMIRGDVPILVSIGDEEIEVHATPRQHHIIHAFLTIIHPEGVEVSGHDLPEGDVSIITPDSVMRLQKNLTERRQMIQERRAQSRALMSESRSAEAEALAMERQMEMLERQAERLEEQAERLQERADELRQRADESNDDQSRRDLLSEAESLIAEANRMMDEARATFEQSSTHEERAHVLENRAEDLEAEAERFEEEAESIEEVAEEFEEREREQRDEHQQQPTR